MYLLRQVLRRMWVAVAVLGAGLAISAAPAGAHEADQWGFAYLDRSNIEVGVPYQPPPNRQASSSGQPAMVTHEATGRYEVTFPGVDASQVGVAHVTSDVPTVECQLQGSYAFGESVTIGVGCRNLGTGAAADARFGIAFSVSTAPPQGGPGGYAALIADEPEHTDYTPFVRFSSSGVDPRIEKPATTGLWYVHLTGAGFAADAGEVQVGAFQTAAHCGVAGRSAEVGGVRVAVQCWTPYPASAPTDDAMFTFTYAQQRNLLGRPTSALPVVTGDRGNYQVTVADVPDAPFNVMVSANDPTTNVCTTFAWYLNTTTNPPSAQGQVYCRTSGGSAATAFSLILTTP